MSSGAVQGELRIVETTGQPRPADGYSALKPSNGNQEDAAQPLNGRTISQDDDIEWQVDHKEEEEYDVEHDEEMIEIENLAMPEDMYGFALTSLFRDSRMVAMGRGNQCVRQGRLVASQAFILVCIFTQAFLLRETKQLVTSMHVYEIRNLYDVFEVHMYNEVKGDHMDVFDNPSHSWITVNGKHRGFKQFWHPENFDSLDEETKDNICKISLSRPNFFMVILAVWSLTCLGEVKACCDMAYSVFWTPTISNFENSLVGDTTSAAVLAKLPVALQQRTSALGPNEQLVVGITRLMRIYVLTLILLPRLLITVVLLWLGCRWLLATVGFEDVLLNAVALEFILVLKDLVYNTVLPERNKKEVTNTSMLPFGRSLKERATPGRFFGSFTLFLGACLWVYLYVFYFQAVLPGYNWDVRGVCTAYLNKITAV